MLLLNVCNGLECIHEIEIELSTFDILIDNIEKIFDNLKTNNYMKCQVYMEFDSISQKFTIKFDQFIKFPRLRSVENTYIHITTSIISTNFEKQIDQTSIKTIVQLVCYSNNQCDRQLVIEHINWLIKTDYVNLESIIRPLISVQGEKTNECTIGNKNHVESCYATACSWHYSIDTQQSEGKCENLTLNTLPILDLTTEIRLFEKHRKQNEIEIKPVRAIFKHYSSIKFSCELNNCNNQQVSELVKDAISQENYLWIMEKIHEIDQKE